MNETHLERYARLMEQDKAHSAKCDAAMAAATVTVGVNEYSAKVHPSWNFLDQYVILVESRRESAFISLSPAQLRQFAMDIISSLDTQLENIE